MRKLNYVVSTGNKLASIFTSQKTEKVAIKQHNEQQQQTIKRYENTPELEAVTCILSG